MDIDFTELKKHHNEKGFLIEFLKGTELDESKREMEQVYVATIVPGGNRGNHYHVEKDEWFSVIAGKLEVAIEDIETKERKDFVLDSGAEHSTRIRVGPKTAHVFQNKTDSTAILVAYMTKIYDSSDPDQYEYVVVD